MFNQLGHNTGMPTGRRRRRTHALVAAALATASLAATATTVDAAPPTTPFPPGLWRGIAVVSGGITAPGVDVHSTIPFKFVFEVEVGADGGVVSGSWTLSGGQLAATVGEGEGTFSLTGAGALEGNGAYLALVGEIGLDGSVNVQGQSYPVDVAVPAEGGFSPTAATCSYVTGDVSAEARDAQQAAGLATTVTGPFTAQRISAKGQALAPGVEEQFVELVTSAETMLAAPTAPAPAALVDLAERAESFYLNLTGSACGGGSPNVEPGTPPYNSFVATLGELIRDALADPSGYSASDLDAIGQAAMRIGVIGAAASDAALAAQVDQVLHDGFAAKLGDAAAAQDHAECQFIASR